MRTRVLNAVLSTGFERGFCMDKDEPQIGFLVEHASIGRSRGSPFCGSEIMTSGMMLIPQPICRYKVCNGSLPPGFSTFRTCLNSGFGAVLQPLHVEETFQLSNRQSTNANAVFDLVHGATVNLACTDYGILKMDANPLDWEGQMGLLNVASPLLGFEEGNACPCLECGFYLLSIKKAMPGWSYADPTASCIASAYGGSTILTMDQCNMALLEDREKMQGLYL